MKLEKAYYHSKHPEGKIVKLYHRGGYYRYYEVDHRGSFRKVFDKKED